jgi:hypothetical protein
LKPRGGLTGTIVYFKKDRTRLAGKGWKLTGKAEPSELVHRPLQD